MYGYRVIMDVVDGGSVTIDSQSAMIGATAMTLVLDSLGVKNLRAFMHLRIEKLGRVNLIFGKNNVGKFMRAGRHYGCML